jgi:hypothetical protein
MRCDAVPLPWCRAHSHASRAHDSLFVTGTILFIVVIVKHGLRVASYELQIANCDAALRCAAHRNRNRVTATFQDTADICSTHGTVRDYTYSTLEVSHDGVPCLECGLVAFRAPSREEPTKS